MGVAPHQISHRYFLAFPQVSRYDPRLPFYSPRSYHNFRPQLWISGLQTGSCSSSIFGILACSASEHPILRPRMNYDPMSSLSSLSFSRLTDSEFFRRLLLLHWLSIPHSVE